MKKWISYILGFLSSTTFWMHITLLLFLSNIIMITLGNHDWGFYISYFLSLVILFSPALLLAISRNLFTIQKNKKIFYPFWIYAFIIHPLILILVFNYHHTNHLVFIPTSKGILYTTPIALIIIEFLLLKKDNIAIDWINKLGLEKSILFVIFTLSIFICGLSFIEQVEKNENLSYQFSSLAATLPTMISDMVLFILVCLAFYFYYYINHYFLVPKLLKEKGIIYYEFSVALVILISYPIIGNMIYAIPFVRSFDFLEFNENQNVFPSDGGFFPFLIMTISTPIIIALQWSKQNKEIANLEKEKSETELNLLKQQINPHFFFNTLNNLYALSITNDKQTPEVIMQLSDLMRYVIYKGKENKVSLKDDIKYIEDYIQLQQIRLHKDFDFSFQKEIRDNEIKIPPLLFIILVENAFKHGIEPSENNCSLDIKIHSNEKELNFICTNSIEEKNNLEKGIGLENMKRRLELLYPERHLLDIQETESEYIAKLKIILT